MSSTPKNVAMKTLGAYLEGEVTASERSAIERALEESVELRRRLDQLKELRAALAAPSSRLDEIDLSARVFRALEVPAAPPRALWPRGWSLVGGVAVAAAVALFVHHQRELERPSEFQPRAAGPALTEAARWAGIQAYRVAETSSPSLVSERLGRGDGLLFSYTNLGARPFEYLMIFALDADKNVRWFYPAYERADSDPKAIRIEKGQSQVALGELIHHDFAPGPLRIFALFTREPLSVTEVERWIAASDGALDRPPRANASLQEIRTEVLP